jgi:hypothetical protein
MKKVIPKRFAPFKCVKKGRRKSCLKEFMTLGKLPPYAAVIIITLLITIPSWAWAFDVTRDNVRFRGDFNGSGTQTSRVGDSFTLRATNPGPGIRAAIVRVTKPDGTVIEHTTNLLVGDNELGTYLADIPGTYSCELRVSQSPEYTILNGTLFAMSESVGGIVIPINSFDLLAPYIGFASTILAATVTMAVYVKRVRRRKEKQ